MPTRLYVGNLPYAATTSDLEQLFAEEGQVQSVTIIVDKFSGRSSGFGFVEMTTAEEAATAMLHLNGFEWMGRILRVNEAKRREVGLDTNSRSGGGGFGSRKY
jgi:RNA recognition motif-containing protein